jgi:4-amino-4-deoxy-L-arabinose transferase-like glycosyltransferase
MGLTFAFCGLAGRELNGAQRGVIAVLLLLGCFGLVVRSHQLITDTAALAGFAVAYYGFALAPRRPRSGGFWIGTGLGLVFMTQGLLESAIIAAIAVALPLFAPWRRRSYLVSFAVAIAAAAPWLLIWPALLYIESPPLFDQWLWQENISRLFARGSEAGLLYYLRILPWYAWPVWRRPLGGMARARRDSTEPVLLPLGFAITLALLSTARHARELYALPLLIPLALLASAGVESLRRGAANAWYWFSITGFTFFVIVAWFYWSGLELGLPARLHAHLHRLQPGHEPGFRLLPFTLAALYTAGWLSILANARRSPDRPVLMWAAGVTTIWALLAILFIAWVDTGKSYRSMVGSLQQTLPRKYQCISSRGLGEGQRAMLHYFGGIITQREEVAARRRNCDLILVQGHPRQETPPRGTWKKIWEGGRPGDKDERYRLYQRR